MTETRAKGRREHGMSSSGGESARPLGSGNSASNNREITTICGFKKKRRLDELWTGRGHYHLPISFTQCPEERSGALAIELARYIVEKQDRSHVVRFGDHLHLGELERQDHGSMLPLGRDTADWPAIQFEGEIIPVWTDARRSANTILRARPGQQRAKGLRVVRCAALVARVERGAGRTDALERCYGERPQPFSGTLARFAQGQAMMHHELFPPREVEGGIATQFEDTLARARCLRVALCFGE
jgi:hypothetical protein